MSSSSPSPPTENYTANDAFTNSSIYGPLETIFWNLWDIDGYLCIVTVVFGALSFVLIPKWRTFTNFAFVNVFLANRLWFILSVILRAVDFWDLFLNSDIETILFDTSWISMPLWQVLAAYSFYMSIVKIFSVQPSGLYLYATLFGWILPATASVGFYMGYYLLPNDDDVRNVTDINGTSCAEDTCYGYEGMDWNYIEYVQIITSIMNLLLYLRVLYVLVFRAKIRSSNRSTVCPRIRIATFIFIISGVMNYMPIFIGDKIKIKPTLDYLPDILYVLQLFLSKVLFLALKSHRTLWTETCKRWCSRRDSVHSTFTTIYFVRRRD